MLLLLLACAAEPVEKTPADPDADADTAAPDTGGDTAADTAADTGETGDSAPPPTPWHPDADGDGFGDPAVTVEAVDAPQGHVADGTDCDDTTAAAFPGAPEVCEDGLDNGCEGDADARCTLDGTMPLDDAGVTLYEQAPGGGAGGGLAVGDLDGDGRADLVIASNAGTYRTLYTVVDVPPGVSPLSPHPTIQGSSTAEIPGDLLAVLPDTDGDGENDLFVAGYYGGAMLLSGYSSLDRWFHSAHTVLTGVDGDGVAALGDADGNGLVRFAVASAAWTGRVHVFEGTGALDEGDALAELYVDADGRADYLGSAMAGCDVDADGFEDLLIGGWGLDADDEPTAGHVLLASGPHNGDVLLARGTGEVLAADARIGVTVELIGLTVDCGDLDGDGYGDLVAATSSWECAGTAWVMEGPFSGTLSFELADATIQGGVAGDGLGAALSAGGDQDGDAQGDLVLSTAEGTTAALLFYGPVRGTLAPGDADARLEGDLALTAVGGPVENRGDVDGDGFDDIVIGNRWGSRHASSAGEVYVVFGGGG